jgi:hypothetical protein
MIFVDILYTVYCILILKSTYKMESPLLKIILRIFFEYVKVQYTDRVKVHKLFPIQGL